MSTKQFLHERAWFLLQFSVIRSPARSLSSVSLVPVALSASIEPRIDGEHVAPGKSAVGDEKEQPCFTLIHLWTSTLNKQHVEWIKRNTECGKEDGQQTQEVEGVRCAIFNQLLSNTITMLNSLDLSIGSEDDSKDLAACMSNVSGRRNKRDFDRYLNLSDLCAGVLDRIEKDDSSTWSKLNMEAFVKSLLLLAMRDTTLCGLLKLLTKSIRICLKSEELKPKLKAMIQLEQLANEVNKSLHPLEREMMVFQVSEACEREQDEEDLFSRLEFALTIPLGFVDFSVHVRVLRRALAVAFAQASLLDRTLEFIEGCIEVDRADLEPELREVCRLVELHVAFGRDSSQIVNLTKIGERRKRLGKNKKDVKEDSRSGLSLTFSQRAIRIIGKASHLMWSNSQQPDRQADAVNHSALIRIITLKTGLLKDMCLDKIASRISEVIAETSGPQVRVTFAECLHTLTCVVIGELKQRIQAKDNQFKQSLLNMFGALYRQVLKLSADVTKQIKTIFTSLNEEIINWITHDQSKYKSVCVHIFDIVIQESSKSPDASRWACTIIEKVLSKNEFTKPSRSQREARAGDGGVVSVLINRVYGILTHPDASQRLTGSSIVIRLAGFVIEREQEYVRFAKDNVLKLITCCIMGLKFASTNDRSLDSERSMLDALKLSEKLLFIADKAGRLDSLEDSEIFIQKLKEGMLTSQASTRIYCRHIIRRLRTESTDTHLSKYFDDAQLLADLHECFKVKLVGASLMFETFLWLESLGFDMEELLKAVGCKQLLKHLPCDEDFIHAETHPKSSHAETSPKSSHAETSPKSSQEGTKRSIRTWQAVKVELLLCKAIFKCVAQQSAPSAHPLISPLCSIFLLDCLCPLGTNGVENTSKVMDEDVLSLLEEIVKIISSCDILQHAAQRSLGALQQKYKLLLVESFEDFTTKFGHGELRIFLKGMLLLLKQNFAVAQTEALQEVAKSMFESINLFDGYPPEFVELALEMMGNADRCFQAIMIGAGKQECNLYLKYGQTYDRYFIAHIEQIECTNSLKTLGMLNHMLDTCRRCSLWVEGSKLGQKIALSHITSKEALQSLLSNSRLQLTEMMQLLKQSLSFLMDAEQDSESMGGMIAPFQEWVRAFLDAKPSLEEFKVLVPLLIDLMQPDCSTKSDENSIAIIDSFVQWISDIKETAIFPAHLSVQTQKVVGNALDHFFADLSEQVRQDAVYSALQKCHTAAGRANNGEACRWMLKEVCKRALVTMTEDGVVSLFQKCFRMIKNCIELMKGRSKFTVEDFNKITCTLQVVRLVYLKLKFDENVERPYCLSPDPQSNISNELIDALSKICTAEMSSTDVAKDCYRTCNSTLCIVFARTQFQHCKSHLIYESLIEPWAWGNIADSELAYEPKDSVIRDFEDDGNELDNQHTADTVSSLSSKESTNSGSQEVWKLTLSEIEERKEAKIKAFHVCTSSLYDFRIDGDRLDQNDCMYALTFTLLHFEQKFKECTKPLEDILTHIQEAKLLPLERTFFLKLVINYCKMTQSEETLKNNQHKMFEVFFDRATYSGMDKFDTQGSFIQLQLITYAERIWFNREELSEMELGEEEKSKCWPFLLHIMQSLKRKPSKDYPCFKLFERLLLKWRKYATVQDLRGYLERIRGLYQAKDEISIWIGLQFQKYIFLVENHQSHQPSEQPIRLDHQELKDVVNHLGTMLTTFFSKEQQSDDAERNSRVFLQPASLLCGGWLTLIPAKLRSDVGKKLFGELKSLARKTDQLIVCTRSLCERYPLAAMWSHKNLRLHENNINENLPEKLEIKRYQLKYLTGRKQLDGTVPITQCKLKDQLLEITMDAMTAISYGRDVDVNFFRLLNGRAENPLAEKEERCAALLPTLDPDQLVDITKDILARHIECYYAEERLRLHYFMTLYDIIQCCSDPKHSDIENNLKELSHDVENRLLMSLGDPNNEARNFFLGWYASKLQSKEPLEIFVSLLGDFSKVQGKNVGDIWLRTASHLMLQSCDNAEAKLFNAPLDPDVTYAVLDCSSTSSGTATWTSQRQLASQRRVGLEGDGSRSTFTPASGEAMEVEAGKYLGTLRHGATAWQPAQTLESLQKRSRPEGQSDRARPSKERFGPSGIKKLRIARKVEQARQRQKRDEMRARSKISMSRRYMRGHVPFIEIRQSELVRLLQLAAWHDDQLCSIVILECVSLQVEDKKPGGRLQGIEAALETRLTECIRQVLSLESFQSSIVLSTLLNVGRMFNITIDARSVVNICKSKSECIYDGILSVENSMLHSSTEEVKNEKNKRKRTEPESSWISLSLSSMPC
eukprot:762893-Hanusia_phi.AAC.2